MNAFLEKMSLGAKIVRRSLKILPKKKKKIKLVYFSHVPDADSNETLIVRYRFTNAVYFAVNGQRTFDNRFVLARPDSKKDIPLTVFGLMRRAHYTITIDDENVFITRNLNTPT